MQVVVVGGKQSGKTLLINTVLGQAEPEPGGRTVNCVRREGKVGGRRLILIDTPGWWRNCLLSDTAEFKKQKLVLSVLQSPPGPHAFILVVDGDAVFTERNRRSVEEHLGLFGENVWEHTIVVFTRMGRLKGKGITGTDKNQKQNNHREDEALRSVMDKCKNRYLIFDKDRMEDPQQITQLLEMIEYLIANNKGRRFPFNKRTFGQVEEVRRLSKEKGILRHERVKNKRKTLRKQGE